MNGIQLIEKVFSTQKAFVAYLTAGDGGMQRTYEAVMALIAGGVNILEIGVPFSDPIADGPVIQRAATRALESGASLDDILDLTTRIRQNTTVPMILFSYFNPILQVLHSDFFKRAKQAGIDGILLVDCPLEESGEFYQQCMLHQIAPIYVITPTTTPERILKIAAKAKGFLYYACRKGTTGIKHDLPDDFSKNLLQIKSLTSLPVVTGFGISNREMAKQVLQYADGFVIGSLFVKAIEEGASEFTLTQLAKTINPEMECLI